MDVKNIGQNGINISAYTPNLSQNTDDNTGIAVPEVQQPQDVEFQDQEGNNGDSEQKNRKDLDDALHKLNNFLKDDKTHAEYSYYKDLKTTIIKIVNDDTKQVILEIPSKKILEMVASMCRQVGLIDKKA